MVQARAVAAHLASRGCVVSERPGWNPRLDDADVAVVMNLTVPEQAWLHMRACRRAAVPYVLLPVFWDLARAIPYSQQPTGASLLPVGSRRRAAAQLARLGLSRPAEVAAAGPAALVRFAVTEPHEVVREVVQAAAAVCPNSASELAHLASFTGLSPEPSWTVVRNGVSVHELPAVEDVLGPRDGTLLSVGGVSPRKNTLGLMRAVAGLDREVVLVGAPPRAGDSYAEQVLAEAPPNVRFAGLLPREEVLRRLATATAHVQPGFVETPGLASLEAAALGTPVVVADTPPVVEYFADAAVYADPHDVASLRRAVDLACRSLPSADLARRIRERYAWDVVLEPLSGVVRAAAARR